MDKALIKEKYMIDLDKGIDRLLSDAPFYYSLLKRFQTENSLAEAEKAYEAKDYQSLFQAVHETKGTSGNLCLDALYSASSILCDFLRHPPYDDESIKKAYGRFIESFSKSIEGIREVLRDVG